MATHRDPVEFYRDHAAEFAGARSQTGMEGDWIEAFAAFVPAGGTVLDAGCGTGEPIAKRLLEASFALTGFDPVPQLLERARARLPAGEFLLADLRTFDLARRFDGVIAWHSLFHLSPDEQRAALPRLARHCAADGVLLFTAGDEAGEAINPCFGEDLYHASLDPGEYRAILEAHGFVVRNYRERDPEAGEATVWLSSGRRSG